MVESFWVLTNAVIPTLKSLSFTTGLSLIYSSVMPALCIRKTVLSFQIMKTQVA